MITLKEAIYRGYRSAAIGNATSLTKSRIISSERAKIREELKKHKLNSEARRYYEQILTLWNNLFISNHWAHKFFEKGISNEATSVKWNLEDCWLDLGLDLEDLPNWNYYKSLNILEPVSFTETPDKKIIILEKEFTDQKLETSDDWKSKYFKLFDLLTHDIWKEEAMRLWLRDNVDRDSADSKVLWHWDIIIQEAGVFFKEATGCLCQLNMSATTYEHPTIEDYHKTKSQIELKYMFLDKNKVNGAGGLYAINHEKLPKKWQKKVEHVDINYE